MMKKRILSVIALLFLAVFSASAYPPPEKDAVPVDEISSKIFSLDGKVIEIEFQYASDLTQKSDGTYRVRCGRWKDRGGVAHSDSESVEFSNDKDALEYFQDLCEKTVDPWSNSMSESIFVLVDGRKLIALGEKYRKSKGIYKW